MFDLSDFDLSCLEIPVSETPSNFHGLVQILINRICTLENIDPVNPGTDGSECPDTCIVPIAPCFYYINPQGDTITTMTLTEYVNAIGNRICTLIEQITILQNEVDTLQEQVNNTITDVRALESNKADKGSLDYQVNAKTNPSAGVQFITDALRHVENSLISTQDAVGSQTLLYQNILKAGLIDDENRAYGTGLMSGISGWTVDSKTTAESIGNLWLAVRDLRAAVMYMKENCCSTGCSDIYLNFRAQLNTSTLTIFTDGSTGFTNDWAECTGKTKITVKDTLGNSTTFTTSILAIKDNPNGYSIDLSPTSVDISTDLTITADTCFINTSTETTCNTDYTYVITNSASCPSVVLTVYSSSVNYQFTSAPGFSYIVNVYYNGGTTAVASQIIATPGVLVLNSIMGLLSDTNYELEIVVVNTSGDETPCPRQAFTTLSESCQPPINASAILTT